MALTVFAVAGGGAQILTSGPDMMMAALALPGGKVRLGMRASMTAHGYWEDPPPGTVPMDGLPDDLEHRLREAETSRVPRGLTPHGRP